MFVSFSVNRTAGVGSPGATSNARRMRPSSECSVRIVPSGASDIRGFTP